MATEPHPGHQQLARHLIDAFEREFWAGHYDRARLVSAPMRVLHQALATAPDPAALLGSVLQALDSSPSD